MQGVFNLLTCRWNRCIEKIAGVVAVLFRFTPASADVVSPAARQIDHLIVIGTGGELVSSFRIDLEALNQLLQLCNFLEKTEKILLRHQDSASDTPSVILATDDRGLLDRKSGLADQIDHADQIQAVDHW